MLASARIPRFDWRQGDWFEAELWLLNDSPAPVAAGRVQTTLIIAGGELPLLNWDFPELPANVNQRGPTGRIQLPALSGPTLRLRLRVAGRPELDSEYVLCCRPK